VVYPPATPSPPADFTPIGEGMKVFSFALLAMTVVISITVLISTRLRPWSLKAMERLVCYIHAAAIISFGTLVLWTVSEFWQPLVILTGVTVAIIMILSRMKKSDWARPELKTTNPRKRPPWSSRINGGRSRVHPIHLATMLSRHGGGAPVAFHQN
jgi:hypothetical protein